MKNQYNRFYIFCTFRGQLILLVVFISINLFNVANYAYTEGCSSLFGEVAGHYARLKEDPNFTPQELSLIQKAALLKEKAAFEGKPLPKNPMPLSTPESQHSLPQVIPDKEVAPLLVYNSTDGSNLNELLADLQNGGTPVHKVNLRKFIHILTQLNKLELKYKDA